MRIALATLAFLGLASPALAVSSDQALLYVQDGHPEQGWPVSATIQLTKGADYLLNAAGYGTVTLTNPQGQPTITLSHASIWASDVQPFRAAFSAAYRVEARLAADHPEDVVANGWLYPDCRDDVRTACQIAPGGLRTGFTFNLADRDWYRAPLVRSAAYVLRLTTWTAPGYLTLRDPRGRLIASAETRGDGSPVTIAYRAVATGTYFAAVSSAGVDNFKYELTLSRR